jgi:hypothetical protein
MNSRRPRDLSSPESIASALVGLLAVVLIGSQALAGRGEPTEPVESARPTIAPNATPTMDPVIRNALATALVINKSLASRIVPLEAAITVRAPVAPEIAGHLRSVNSDLTAGNEAADRLLFADATADLGVDLEAFYDGVRTRNAETLGTTIRNTDAYVAGARAVIEMLAQLPAFNDRITDELAGRPAPTATPIPTPSASTSAPATPRPPTLPPASQTTLPSGSPAQAASLVVNGGFEDGLSGWQLQLTDGAQATMTHEPGGGPDASAAARVDISIGSQARSGISLMTSPVALAKGATYVVELAVRSAEVREVRVRLIDGAGQTTAARVFPVGTAWSVISFEVTQLVADPAVWLGLDLGRSNATVWFDNVAIRESPG